MGGLSCNDFYPRSPCGERQENPGKTIFNLYFYPRSPCGERLCGFCEGVSLLRFLSTLSLRRATCYSLRYSTPRRHFYPRSPCGERQSEKRESQSEHCISIHALLAESDICTNMDITSDLEFLSTLSLRRATSPPDFCYLDNIISIHALLAESDGGSVAGNWPRVIFLSTLSLRRATVGRSQGGWLSHGFLSTLSLRRATLGRVEVV